MGKGYGFVNTTYKARLNLNFGVVDTPAPNVASAEGGLAKKIADFIGGSNSIILSKPYGPKPDEPIKPNGLYDPTDI